MKMIRAVIFCVAINLLVLPAPAAGERKHVEPEPTRTSTEQNSWGPLDLLIQQRLALLEAQPVVEEPAEEPQAAPAEPPPPPAPAPSPTGDVWQRLAQCESNMSNANTGNGYYGYFQFSVATWHSVGGSGLPSDHDYATQLHFAQILQARSGWGQWPACSRALGLR